MKKSLSFAVTAGLMTTLISGTVFASNFTDLDQKDVYAKTEINALYDAGIVSGYNKEGTIFAPLNNITREEFAKIVASAYGLVTDTQTDKATCEENFDDVDDWAKPYVGALFSAGFIQGIGNKKFGALDNLTREQMAAILIRSLGMEEGATFASAYQRYKQSEFEDSSQFSEYASDDIRLSREIGLILGDGKKFDPSGLSQRQAVARLAYEVLQKGDTEYIPSALKLAIGNVTDATYDANDKSFTVTLNNPNLTTQSFKFTGDEVHSGFFEIFEVYQMNLGSRVDAWKLKSEEDKINALDGYIYTWVLSNSPYKLDENLQDPQGTLRTAIESQADDYVLTEANLVDLAKSSGVLQAPK